MSASQSSSQDFEQVEDQLFLREFLKATSRPIKTFRFIRTDVAIQLTRSRASDELKLYAAHNHHGGPQDVDQYLRRILAKYPTLYPKLRLEKGPYFTPIRSEAEIEAYLKNGAVNAVNENDLRLSCVENEIILLRRVYHYLQGYGKKADPLRVNKDIFKGIKGNFNSLMTLVFGFRAHKTFLKLHPQIFEFSTIGNSTFVSFNWDVDLENYISNVERFKVPENSATSNVERFKVPENSATSKAERFKVPENSATSRAERFKVPENSATSNAERFKVPENSATSKAERFKVPENSATSNAEQFKVPENSATSNAERFKVPEDSATSNVERFKVPKNSTTSNAERFKVPENSATFIARDKQEVKTVGLLVNESIKIAGETRVVFNNEMSQILKNKYVEYPDTTSEDLKRILDKYSAIFQPIISLSNSKKPKCIGYYIAPQPNIYHILNSSADLLFEAVKVPPEEVRVLERRLKAIKREIECLKAVHEVFGELSVECGLEGFQHLVDSLFNNVNKKFITDFGIVQFLEKYAEFFDLNDKGLYKLRFGSEELLLAHSEALLNAGRNLFRDAFVNYQGEITSYTTRQTKNEQLQMATAGETRDGQVANRIPNETTTVRVLVEESIKIAGQSRVIFVDEMNQILNDKRDTSNANLKRILDKYSAIFQPIISLTNAKKPECIIGYCIASQSKMNLVLNSSPDRVFEAVKVPAKEIKIIERQFERIKSEISSLKSVRGQLSRQFDGQFTRSRFINLVHNNIGKADAQFIKKCGFDDFLLKHKTVFIFPPRDHQDQEEPYDYEVRLASEESFNLYIEGLLMDGRNLFRDAFEKHSGEDAFTSLSFSECLYQDEDESYLDLFSSLVHYQPDEESLSLMAAAAAVSDKSTQTDSSGLVSSVFLYPI